MSTPTSSTPSPSIEVDSTPTPDALTPSPTPSPNLSTPTPDLSTPTLNQSTPTPADADGDGYSPEDGDCDDADPNQHPGAPEVPNGEDDDCDGEIDDNEAPELRFLAPPSLALAGPVEARVRVLDDQPGEAVRVWISDGSTQTEALVPVAGTTSATFEVGCGEHTFTATAVDAFDARGDAERRFRADLPPTLVLTPPAADALEQGRRLSVGGVVSDPCQTDATELLIELRSDLDGPLVEASPAADGAFELSTVNLSPGLHLLTVTATDPWGLSASEELVLEVFPYLCEGVWAARYDLGEGSGTASADTSGNNNHLALYGGPSWSTGRDGAAASALGFDGVDDLAIAPDHASLDLDAAVSIGVWFYLDALPPGPRNWWTLVTKGTAESAATNRNYSLYVRNDGVLHWSQSNPAMTGQALCQNSLPGVISAGRWHHVVVMASPTGGGTKTYFVDGHLQEQYAGCGNTSLVPNDGPLMIGDSNEVNHNLKGRIDQIEIRPCEMTEGQVAELWAAEAP